DALARACRPVGREPAGARRDGPPRPARAASRPGGDAGAGTRRTRVDGRAVTPSEAWSEHEEKQRRLALKNVAGWAGGFVRHRWTSTGHEIRLGLRNVLDRDEPATGDVPVVVSMTSYGKRLRRTAYLALESIARG